MSGRREVRVMDHELGVEYWHNRFGWWFQVHFLFASTVAMWRPTFKWADRASRAVVRAES